MNPSVQAFVDRETIITLLADIAAMQARVVKLRQRNPAMMWVLSSLKTTQNDLSVALLEAE